MTEFIRFVLRRRWAVSALLLASLALSLYSARTIESRFQFRDFYDYPANPHVELFKQDNAEFGDPAGYVVALVESRDVFRPEILAYVKKLTRELESSQTFVRVRSISNVNVVREKGEDVVSGPLYDEVPASAESMAELKQMALASKLLRRRLLSEDGTMTAILAEMRTPAAFATVEEQRAAVTAVQKVMTASPPPGDVTYRITGAPAIEVEGTDSLNADQSRLMPFVMLVLLCILYLTFRSWHGIVLCLASVLTAVIWTFGVFSLFGRPVDIIASIIPTTLLVYAVVDPVFVLSRVLSKADAGRSKSDSIVESLSELALPCFLTSVATALGFAGFALARSPMIRYFGITVAIGVLLAWVTSITVLPLLLSMFPLPKRRFEAIGSNRVIAAFIASTWRAVAPRAWSVAAVAVIAVLGTAAYARSIIIDNTYFGDLPQGKVVADARLLENKLSGVVRLIVHLAGPVDAMKDPKVLQAIERVDIGMEQEPMVTTSSSLADVVGEANAVFSGDPAARRVADSRSLNAQYLALIDPLDRADFVTADYSKSHIAILLKDRGSAETLKLTERLQRLIDDVGFGELGVKASLTGNGVVGYQEIDELCRELLWGFVLALSVIVLLEWILFRSLRLALISVLPNLVPVAACFLTLHLLGHPLRLDSVLVLCISIGGLFNTTIHIAARVRSRVAEGNHEPVRVIAEALSTVGPAALFTTVTLSAGFAVLTLSSFPGLRMLGLLSMVTLVAGFIADLLVTPALLWIAFDWKKAARESVRPIAEALPANGASLE